MQQPTYVHLSRFVPIIVLLFAVVLIDGSALAASTAPSAETTIYLPLAYAPETSPDLGGRDPKTLVIRYWQAPSTLNPHLSGAIKDQDAAAIVLEPLANLTPEGTLTPALAAEIPTLENGGLAQDLTAITWRLRAGVKWADGSDFTADDVVFTYDYCTNPATGCANRSAFEGVSSVEAVDPLTVKVTFDGPTAYPYQSFVTSYSGAILQASQFSDCVGAAAQGCSEENRAPIGTGPYQVERFRVNDEAAYVRNPHWRDEPAFFERVILQGGGDPAAAAGSVLQTAKADYAWNLQVEPGVLKDMLSAGNGVLESSMAGSVERILVNQTNPDPGLGDLRSEYDDGKNPHPFLTVKVIPQAMSMAIDRSVIADQLYGPAGEATCNVIAGPPHYASTANDACLTQDIDGAKDLLDDAGIVDGDGDGIREYNGIPLRVRYQTSTNSVRQKTQALVKQWWSEIGVETELVHYDPGEFFSSDPNSPNSYRKFYADIQMYNTGPSIDPQQHLTGWLCNAMAGRDNGWSGNNIFRGCSPAFDQLYAQLARTPVGPQREQIVVQMNDINVQSGFQIPLVRRGAVSARLHGLTGIQMNGGWDSELWNIEDWARQ